MNIALAILLFGASGSAERSMESTDSIAGIVAQCLGGLLSDGLSEGGFLRTDRIDLGQTAKRIEEARVRLVIDGRPRTGLRAWGEAAWRVGGYVADIRASGSVGYSYGLRVRKYQIATSTEIADGRVEKVVDAWWTDVVVIPLPKFLQRLLKKKAIIREVPIHAQFRITATERASGTVLVGVATGRADTSEFCLHRIAERQASEQLRFGLRDALATIERGGRQFYAGGSEIADMLDGIHLGLQIFRIPASRGGRRVP